MCCQGLGVWPTNSKWKPHDRPHQSLEFNIDDVKVTWSDTGMPSGENSEGGDLGLLNTWNGRVRVFASQTTWKSWWHLIYDTTATCPKISQHWFPEFDVATIFRIKFAQLHMTRLYGALIIFCPSYACTNNRLPMCQTRLFVDRSPSGVLRRLPSNT